MDSAVAEDERQRAIQKFMARAELSKLTRGLRARLSYASYKATHNLIHTTLNDLEEQTERQVTAAAPSASPIKSANNYYNNPATQGNSAMASAAASRAQAKRGSMLPPSSTSASAGKSLYTSILAPPPAKRARTIHNPQDPPIVAPPKPSTPTPTPARKGGKRTRATPTTSSKQKSKKDAKGKGKDTGDKSSGRRLTPHSSFEDNTEVDMKAAATLTSLLLSRPSLSASSPRSSMSAGSDAGSLHSYSHFAQSSTRTTTAPTSAMPSQDHTYAAPYGRSSTPPPLSKRTQSLSQPSDVRFYSHSRVAPNAKVTPKTQSQPVISASARAHGDTHSPHNAPTDTEAADLMLFLATSPSPVRPTTVKDRDARDLAAFRSLSGNPALQGRVLFSGSGPGPGNADGQSHSPSHHGRGKPLQREGSGFSSTLSIATDASGETVYAGGSSQQKSFGRPFSTAPSFDSGSSSRLAPSSSHPMPGHYLGVPQMPTITPPTPTDQAPQHPAFPGQRPPSPTRSSSRTSGAGSTTGRAPAGQPMPQGLPHHAPYPPSTTSSSSSSSTSTPVPLYQYQQTYYSPHPSAQSVGAAPPTPSNGSFNLHDFLNVSPSPAASTPQKTGSASSLRADVTWAVAMGTVLDMVMDKEGVGRV
ncbi:hypothetical protein EIP91_011520 [Steccherinum ochraceum]|uniref:Uncharacterized protein n=1 Tax=Steccherinum ochraceum TaxID=92696 RepID=A0A4V2MUT2_9APHY|nr:hypothetical protein EIP91_011520 [Steccherinum ochraceum]